MCVRARQKIVATHSLKIHDVENVPEAVQQFLKLNNDNEKPFEGKICDEKFARKSRLTDHNAEVHEKSIKCDICTSNFKTQQTLTVHIKHVHEGKNPMNAQFAILNTQAKEFSRIIFEQCMRELSHLVAQFVKQHLRESKV